MPAYLVHRLAGERTASLLKTRLPNMEDYTVGLQGADIFFAYRPFRKRELRRFPYRLHNEKTREFFEQSFRYIKEYGGADKDRLVSYFAGYIVHYCVDKALHPFVFARAKDSRTHNLLEFMLDARYYADIKGGAARNYDIAGEVLKKILSVSVGRFYREIGREIYGADIPEDMASAAQRTFSGFRKTLNQSGPWHHAFILLARVLTGNDIEAFIHPRELSWDYFTPEEYETLKKGIADAADEAAGKIEKFLAFLVGGVDLRALMADYGNVNFKGETY